MIFIGIDPGVSGGIGVVGQGGGVLATHKMPETVADLVALLRSYGPHAPNGSEPSRAAIEQVYSSPQMGVVSAFTFGRGLGRLEAALAAAEIPFDFILPRKWQAAVGVVYPKKAKGDKTPRDKNVTKTRAQQLFPGTTITHANADALLIADFCRRWHTVKEPR